MNAKTQHTPGPWTVHNNIGRKGELGVTANAAPCVICTMSNVKEWPTEADANAHLIAAAPELLAALHRMVYWLSAVGWIASNKDMRADVDAAYTAIRKAEGGTP